MAVSPVPGYHLVPELLWQEVRTILVIIANKAQRGLQVIIVTETVTIIIDLP